MSHFFAYLSRMKYIRRWGLMRNSHPESIQEHSHRVAVIAHGLAEAKNRLFGGAVDPGRVAVLALFHDAGEVITGDLPTPIKYFNPKIKDAYREIETVADERLLSMVPEPLREAYADLFAPGPADAEHLALVRAADKICAYMKCLEEKTAGNLEFAKAEKAIETSLRELDRPEVRWFLETYLPSFELTLDELD